MISVLASIEIKAGKVPEFLKAVHANLPHVLAEEGCIEYMPMVDVETDIAVQVADDNIVTIVEKWESLEALQEHLKAPHMLIYRAQVSDIVENTTLKVLTSA